MAAEVRLRDLRPGDLPQLHRWYGAPELWDHLVGDFTPRSEREALAHMRRWLEAPAAELRLAAEVAGPEGARMIGLAMFSPLRLAEGWGELHTFIGEPGLRGRGLGRDVVAALMARGWALGLTRIELRVLETNVAARRVYGRCGFRVSGRASPAIKRGRPVEVLVMEAYRPRSATT